MQQIADQSGKEECKLNPRQQESFTLDSCRIPKNIYQQQDDITIKIRVN